MVVWKYQSEAQKTKRKRDRTFDTSWRVTPQTLDGSQPSGRYGSQGSHIRRDGTPLFRRDPSWTMGSHWRLQQAGSATPVGMILSSRYSSYGDKPWDTPKTECKHVRSGMSLLFSALQWSSQTQMFKWEWFWIYSSGSKIQRLWRATNQL